MNERIKALAVEADFMLCEDSHFYSEGQSQKITAGLQKFAELIVRECVGIVEGISPGYKDYRDQIEDAFRRDCMEEIKQHFGVE